MDDTGDYTMQHPARAGSPLLSETVVLTPAQQHIFDRLVDFTRSDASVARLSGAAGTGKTTLIQHFVASIRGGARRIVMTAPTHKAAGVMRRGVSEGGTVVTMTLQSCLGLVPVRDTTTGEETYQQQKPVKLKPGDLLLVDEASMVSSGMLSMTLDAATLTGAQVLFVGDAYQLPPPSENTDDLLAKPPVFGAPGDAVIPLEHWHELTEIMRQAAGNPILAAAHQYRRFLIGEPMDPAALKPQTDDNGHGIEMMNGPQLTGEMQVLFGDMEEAHNADVCRLVSYTNAKVIAGNNYIRSQILGREPVPPFIASEYAVSNTAVSEWDPVEKEERLILLTDEIVTVISVRQAKRYGLDGHEVSVERPSGDMITAFMPQSRTALDAHLKQMAATAERAQGRERSKAWQAFFEVKNRCADLRSVYACTVHKSQGSTYDTTIINVRDILDKGLRSGGPLISRLLYVALTRARYRVIINAPLPYFRR